MKELKKLDKKATVAKNAQVQIEGNRTVPEIPNTRLRKAFRDAEKEYKGGKMKVYTNHEDLEKDLI